MIKGVLVSEKGNTHAPPGVRQRTCWPGAAGARGWVAAGNMPAKGELGVPENHEKARPDLARRASTTIALCSSSTLPLRVERASEEAEMATTAASRLSPGALMLVVLLV